jgi:hypothetical protein
MLKTTFTLTLLAATLVAPARAACLRIMTPQELAEAAILIARVRVTETDDSDWGEFGQIAKVEILDVIEGDFTLKNARVLARSHVACADDHYAKKEEFVVFLEQRGGLYHTVNFQYGQFRVEGEVVKGWRDAEGTAREKPYYSVREDIEAIVAGIRNPKPEQVPDQTTPATAAPVDPEAPPPQQGSTRKPKANLVPSVKKPKVVRLPDQQP